ncbi:MAG: NADH-quinone oxidoreductase subunit NuoG [Pseudomonadota bacterium]
MSDAKPDNQVTVEVNGVPVQATKGQMLIEVTDKAGIYVPRFCYHEKLSIAANCRMCLVEVEKAPKPLPACATPVMDGMKVMTKSPRAISAQKATMEFLLINHPLDCPICDQGGECELQDLAMGFGRDVSRYNQSKRVVKDKNLGPLVSTDMTRCIHCTRCVRFGEEVSGIAELGTLGRGEHMEIGTYVERGVNHELSGNIIDLCPVGALNSKPFRFRARSWEMLQQASVSPHDCVGSNLYAHVLQGKLMRVVPRPNEAINETWIADRDRFSYAGVYSDDRLQVPMLKSGGEWAEVGWEAALEACVKGLQDAVETHGAEQLATLASPSSTTEELALLSRITRGLGSANIDHRLRMRDFSGQDDDPAYPSLGQPIEALDRSGATLLVGSHLRHEAPILAHRVRKAALAGGSVSLIAASGLEFLFPVAAYHRADQTGLAAELAAVLKAALGLTQNAAPAGLGAALAAAEPSDEHRRTAAALAEAERATVLMGNLAMRHSAFADLRALAAALASATGATLGFISEGANSAGACLAGAQPHRGIGADPVAAPGLDARQAFEQPRQAYLLHNFEADADCGDPALAVKMLRNAPFVTALTPYVTDSLKSYANVLLPVGTFAETSGTYVNVAGVWQSFTGVARPLGDARPAWKVLRVLGNLLGLTGFDYTSSEEVRDELQRTIGEVTPDNALNGGRQVAAPQDNGAASAEHVPMYAIDSVVRRSSPLQETARGAVAP